MEDEITVLWRCKKYISASGVSTTNDNKNKVWMHNVLIMHVALESMDFVNIMYFYTGVWLCLLVDV